MPFPGGAGGGNSRPSGSIAYASMNVREGAAAEVSGATGSGGGRVLVYKFFPKYPGEYRISGDVMGPGTAVLSVGSAVMNQSTTANSLALGAAPLLSALTPLGTTIILSSNPAANNVSTNLAEVIIGSNANGAYGNVSGTFVIAACIPVFVFAGSSNSGGTNWAKNIQISYDVR